MLAVHDEDQQEARDGHHDAQNEHVGVFLRDVVELVVRRQEPPAHNYVSLFQGRVVAHLSQLRILLLVLEANAWRHKKRREEGRNHLCARVHLLVFFFRGV